MPPEFVEPTDKIEGLDDIVKTLIIKPGAPNGATPPRQEAREQEEAHESQAEAEGQEVEEVQRPDPRERPDEVREPSEEREIEEPAGEDDEDEDIDIDAIQLDVLVDGKLRKVAISELKKRYSFESAIDQRMEQATRTRDAVMQQANDLNNVYTHMHARLVALDKILEQAEAPPANMDELRVKDPTKWLFERERLRDLADRRRKIAEEQAKIEQNQASLRQAALVEHAKKEAYLLGMAAPEFADPKTSADLMKRMTNVAAKFGYTPQEVNAVVDHRALLVLKIATEAIERDEKERVTKEKARTAPRVLLKPGVKKSAQRTTQQKQMQALRAKARETGKVEDVAATLIVRGR